jgi:hypothetical protein
MGLSTISKITGQQIDSKLLGAFMDATKNDGKITAPEVKGKIAKFLVDSNSFSKAEQNTVLFAMQHLKFTAAGDKEMAKLVSKLRPNATTQNALIARGMTPPLPFADVYDSLQKTGRLADIYAVKTVMTSAQMTKMWSEGITLVELNDLLKKALRPAKPEVLRREFKNWNIDDVISSFTPKMKERFDNGQMSRGELQNLVYRSWEKSDPSLKGLTPYDKSYKATYSPIT